MDRQDLFIVLLTAIDYLSLRINLRVIGKLDSIQTVASWNAEFLLDSENHLKGFLYEIRRCEDPSKSLKPKR
jgi:hypothetical protein